MIDLADLPSGTSVAKGIEDLARGRTTVEALLVSIASRRLHDLGLSIPTPDRLPQDPELGLYNMLCSAEEDPFFRYRSLVDGLDSFIASLESLNRTLLESETSDEMREAIRMRRLSVEDE